MSKNLILILILVIGFAILGFVILNPIRQKNSSPSPVGQQSAAKEIKPSETLKEYSDPSGFTLSYPDNLSLVKNEITDEQTYADIQLTSKDVNGSLNLKITDSKVASVDGWLKSNKITSAEPPKEVELGSLKGLEVKTSDRLLLGALDNGILFNIEVPLIEKDFWMKVYNKVLTNFSFAPPEAANSTVSNTDISFEGEEIVE